MRLARRNELDLWFEDECHFQQHGSRCVMWIPPEETDPTLLHAPTRKSVAVFGAVCVTDGRFSCQRAPGAQPGSDQAITLEFRHKCAKEGRFHSLEGPFRNQNDRDKIPEPLSVHGQPRSK